MEPTYIIKVICNETGNIFIGYTKNLDTYINLLYRKKRGKKKTKAHTKLSFNLKYEILEILNKNQNPIFEKIKYIKLFPECLNGLEI